MKTGVASVCLAGLSLAALGAELRVGQGEQFEKVGDALAAARVSDRIVVLPGVYKETLRWPRTQGLTLVAKEGPDRTVLEGDGQHPVCHMEGKLKWDTTLEGFTIRGGGSGNARGEFGAGLNIVGASPTIRNCRITGNVARPYRGTGGVFLWGSHAVLEHNEIAANKYQAGTLHAGGVCVWGGMPKVSANLIQGNSGDNPAFFTRAAGVRLQGSKTLLFDNAIRENTSTSFGAALYAAQSDRSCVFGNVIAGNRSLGGSAAAVAVELNSDPQIGGEAPGEPNAVYDNLQIFVHDDARQEAIRNLHAEWLGAGSKAVRANDWGGTGEETLARQLEKLVPRPKAAAASVKAEQAGLTK